MKNIYSLIAVLTVISSSIYTQAFADEIQSSADVKDHCGSETEDAAKKSAEVVVLPADGKEPAKTAN